MEIGRGISGVFVCEVIPGRTTSGLSIAVEMIKSQHRAAHVQQPVLFAQRPPGDLLLVDHNRLNKIARAGIAPWVSFAYRPDDVHPLDYLAEHSVLAIEVGCWAERDEELAAVGARARVGHR